MKRSSSKLFLICLFFLCGCTILYTFSYQSKIDIQYMGKLYMLEEDTLVEIEDLAITLSGIQTKSLQDGTRLCGQIILTSETISQDVFFITKTSNIIKEIGWYRALLSSGPPEGGPIKMGAYTCNEMYFEKSLFAFALPIEDDMCTFLLIATDKEADLKSVQIAAVEIFQGMR